MITINNVINGLTIKLYKSGNKSIIKEINKRKSLKVKLYNL